MAFSPSTPPLWQRLSPRGLKGISLGVLVCMVAAFLILWQPGLIRLRSLQEDKIHWQRVLRTGVIYSKTVIPTMDQLPDMIELCRDAFVNEGVEVISVNVERFGERREAGKGETIDYALVSLRLQGQWKGIITSLKVLEEWQGVSFRAQEVMLAEEGGEVLLQIYFGTGE